MSTGWCSLPGAQDEAARRIEQRATGDAETRLAAWDEIEPLDSPDLVVDTQRRKRLAIASAANQPLSLVFAANVLFARSTLSWGLQSPRRKRTISV